MRSNKEFIYYTNILGQRFYSEADLMRNIKDAKARGLGIYAPEFDPSTLGTSSSPFKKKRRVIRSSVRNSKIGKSSSSRVGKRRAKSNLKLDEPMVPVLEAGMKPVFMSDKPLELPEPRVVELDAKLDEPTVAALEPERKPVFVYKRRRVLELEGKVMPTFIEERSKLWQKDGEISSQVREPEMEPIFVYKRRRAAELEGKVGPTFVEEVFETLEKSCHQS